MGIITNENFESLTAGQLITTLSGWTDTTAAAKASTTHAHSGSMSITCNTVGILAEPYYSGATDGNGGNAQVSCWFLLGDTSDGNLYLICRAMTPPTNTTYFGQITAAGTIKLGVKVGGSAPALQTYSGDLAISGGLSTGVWYFAQLVCNFTSIKLDIQRASDGQWVQASSGTFGASQPATGAINATDNQVSGAGNGGFLISNSTGLANTFYIDDFEFQTPTFPNIVQSSLTAFPVVQQGFSGNITGATNAAPIVITSTAHGLTTGTVVTIASVGGNTAANGTWPITVLTANTFSLNNSTGNASYTSGGTWTVQGVSVTLGQSVVAGHTLVAVIGTYAYPVWSNVTGATNASPIEITTGIAHNLSTGNTAQISGVQGNTAANGLWPVHVTSSTTFTLDGSTGNGTYTNATGYWSPHPVTDNIGNGNWNVLGPPSINGQNILSAHFVYSSASGVPTVTIEPLQGSSGFITVYLCELSGINVSTPDSFVAANGNIQSTNSPGTITVTTTRDLVIAAFCQGLNNIDNATVDSGFTMLGLQTGGIAFECLGVAAKISGSNETPTFSTFSGGSPQTVDWSGLGISLKAVVGSLPMLLRQKRRTMLFPLNATSQSVDVDFVDDSGLPLTGKVAADFPTLTLSQAGAHSDTAVGSLTDLSTLTSAWSAGGIKERGNGRYRVDLPNAAFATVGHWTLRGEATGKHVLCDVLDVVQFIGSDNRSNLGGFLDHTFTETSGGYIAAGFSKLFNVATPVADVSAGNSGITKISDLLSAQQLATAIMTDSQSSDFTNPGTPGYLFMSQLASMVEADPEHSGYFRLTRPALFQGHQDIVNGMAAFDLYGQSSFTADSGAVNQSTLGAVGGIALDPVNWRLFVAEPGRNRIMIFDVTPGAAHNGAAIAVIGQTNFTNSSANQGNAGFAANYLKVPEGLWYDALNQKLWCADTGNSRVLVYDMAAFSLPTNQFNYSASFELGQISLTSGGSANRGSTANNNTLSSPTSVTYDPTNNRLFVADEGNSRITGYALAAGGVPTANGQAATIFLGQTNSTNTSTGSTTSTMNSPNSVLWDDQLQRVIVGDGQNLRLMIFENHIVTGGACDQVLSGTGQATIDVAGNNMALHSERRWLFVPDVDLLRVSIWDLTTVTTGQPAAYVLGQPDWVAQIAAIDASHSFGGPNAVVIDEMNERAFVGQTNFNGGRVVVYQLRNYLRRNTATDFPALTEPTARPAVNGNMVAGVSFVVALCLNKRLETATLQTLRNSADNADITSRAMTDNGTTLTVGAFV